MRSPSVAPPRWLVDEMLGRLARYLRFVGCDTVYARGSTDDDLLARARREGRVLLTRDRQLSHRGPNAFLIESPHLADQWRAVRATWPTVPTEPSFDRCSHCNGLLEVRAPEGLSSSLVPPKVRDGNVAVYGCRDCGHLYWVGSHTRRIRERIHAWERGAR